MFRLILRNNNSFKFIYQFKLIINIFYDIYVKKITDTKRIQSACKLKIKFKLKNKLVSKTLMIIILSEML